MSWGHPSRLWRDPRAENWGLLPVAIACLPDMGVNCFGKALPVPVKPSDNCNSSWHLDCAFMRYPEESHPAELLWVRLWKCHLLSHVWLFVTPWTAAHQAPWDFPGKDTGGGCHSLLRGVFPIQGWNPVSCTTGRFVTIEPLGKP